MQHTLAILSIKALTASAMYAVVYLQHQFAASTCTVALPELMFNGCFHGLDKHQLLALVSCLLPCDKSTEQVGLLCRGTSKLLCMCVVGVGTHGI